MCGAKGRARSKLLIIISTVLVLFSANIGVAEEEEGCKCPMAEPFKEYYTSPGGVVYIYGAVDLGPTTENDLCGYPYPFCTTKKCKVRILVYYNSSGSKYEITTETRACAAKPKTRIGDDPVCAN